MKKLILTILTLMLALSVMAQKPDTLKPKVDTNYLNRRINHFIEVYNKGVKQIDTLTMQINKLKENQTFLIGVIQGYQALKDEAKPKK